MRNEVKSLRTSGKKTLLLISIVCFAMLLIGNQAMAQDEAKEIEAYLSQEKKNIVFVIGSTWESRNYPKEKFAEIANVLEQNVLIVWGSDEERSRAEWIEAHSEYAKSLPKMSKPRVVWLRSSCHTTK